MRKYSPAELYSEMFEKYEKDVTAAVLFNDEGFTVVKTVSRIRDVGGDKFYFCSVGGVRMEVPLGSDDGSAAPGAFDEQDAEGFACLMEEDGTDGSVILIQAPGETERDLWKSVCMEFFEHAGIDRIWKLRRVVRNAWNEADMDAGAQEWIGRLDAGTEGMAESSAFLRDTAPDARKIKKESITHD